MGAYTSACVVRGFRKERERRRREAGKERRGNAKNRGEKGEGESIYVVWFLRSGSAPVVPLTRWHLQRALAVLFRHLHCFALRSLYATELRDEIHAFETSQVWIRCEVLWVPPYTELLLLHLHLPTRSLNLKHHPRLACPLQVCR